ncbi:MAG TPA: hypothetical protein VGJ95_16555 [Pseudonocardiaceae bacterium]|jgi:hypothetical protein
MSDNGKVDALEEELLDVDGNKATTALDRQLTKVRLDPDLLTFRDMKRARVVLGGRNPWELLEDPDERGILIVWCIRSRTDPAFTWDDAENTSFGQLEAASGGEPPPQQGGKPGSSGPEPAISDTSRSKRKPRAAASASNSPPSTG